MDQVVQDPTFQVSAIQQCLSGGKSPIGLFLGAGCPTAIRLENQSPLIPDIKGITRYFPYWESSGSKGSPNEMMA